VEKVGLTALERLGAVSEVPDFTDESKQIYQGCIFKVGDDVRQVGVRCVLSFSMLYKT